MSTVAIRAEGISKKYLISHRRTPGGQTFREAATAGLLRAGRRLLGPLGASAKGLAAGPRSQEEFWALQDVTFEVGRGERVGIIGRNGAGKSTLLKVLSRITYPTKGRISLNGRVASLLEVGTGFHPELTGRENIYLNGAILGMGREEIRRKFDEIVDFSEVEKFLDVPVKRYSSGMYVRLAFAVAAHLEPEILLVDEVLAVGDAQFQRKCLGKMEDVSDQGRTIMFVSHNLNAVNRLCGRALLLDGGRIARHGPVAEVIQEYLAFGAGRPSSEATFARDPARPHQVLGVRVCAIDGSPVEDHVEASEPFRVAMTFALAEPLAGGYGVLQVRNQNGDIVFFSDSRDVSGSVSLTEPGIVDATVTVPAPLLLPGRYSCMVAVARHEEGGVDVRESAVSFDVVDLKGHRIRRPGAVFQLMKWEPKRTP